MQTPNLVKVVVLATSAVASVAQTPAPLTSQPQFEVASVKPNTSMSGDSSLNRSSGGSLNVVNATLRMPISFAYRRPQLPTQRRSKLDRQRPLRYRGKASIAGYPSADLAPKTRKCIWEQAGLKMKYLIIYEKTSTGYSAYVPDLPGCVAASFSFEETANPMRRAVELHLKSMRTDGGQFPTDHAGRLC
jgi:predicted RNase H-like HicB family nuclease